MNITMMRKEFVRALRKLNDTAVQLTAYALDEKRAAKTLQQAKAERRSATSLGAKILSIMRDSPDKTWTNKELGKLLKVTTTNITTPLHRLYLEDEIVKVGRGRHRLSTAKDKDRTPPVFITKISPESVAGRMITLLDNHKGKGFRGPEIAKLLQCNVNAVRQAVHVLKSRHEIIAEKGVYRSVRRPDAEGGVNY